jgi:hypothetical protein
LRDLDCILERQPARHVVHCIHSHDDREGWAKLLPHCGDDFSTESEPVFKCSAIRVLATVAIGRQELVDQVAVAERDFQRIEASSTDTARGTAKGSDNLDDSLFGERARQNPVCGAGHLRSGYQIVLRDQS